MCLFNRDVQGMNCGHEECKNYYMLNKQMCMYGLNQSSTSNTIKPTLNNIQKPIAQTPQGASQKPNQSFSTPQDLNAKRPKNPLSDDLEESPTNKMVKAESKTDGSNHKMTTESQPNHHKIQEPNQFSQPSAGLGAPGGDKNLLNNIILNNLFLSKPQAGTNIKQDATMQNMQNMSNPNILLSLLQNPPGNFPLNAQLQNKALAQQSGLNPLAFPQLFPQNLGGKPGQMNNGQTGSDPNFGMNGDNMSPNGLNANNMNVANLINDIKLKSENGLTGDSFLREFQGRILGLLFTQNKMLTDLKEKNDVLQDTLACLINEINTIKSSTKQTTKEKVTGTASALIPSQFMGTNTETVSVEDLINFLYGPSPDFQYQLILKSDLPLPLYRERNFKFTVILTDKNGNVVENSNRIPLTIGLYSSENPPKYIDANTAGNKILKGFIEKDLTNGSATFEKIQIKEVTSHFRNGWIFFVVYPKVTNTNPNNMLMGTSGVSINSQKIKPLILEKVVVKAKKAKEKEMAGEMDGPDDNPSVHNEENQDENK